MCECTPECRAKTLAIIGIIYNLFYLFMGIGLCVVKLPETVTTTTGKSARTSEVEQAKKIAQQKAELEVQLRKYKVIVGSILAAKGFVGLICSVLLLIGAIKENRCFVMVYLVYGILMLLLYLVLAILCFIGTVIGMGVSFIVQIVIYALLLWFCVKALMANM